MAKKDLKTFLEQLHEELKQNSEEYRKETANKLYTTFEYKEETIKRTLRTLLSYSKLSRERLQNAQNAEEKKLTKEEKQEGEKLLEEIEKDLKPLLDTLTTNIKISVNALIGRAPTTTKKKSEEKSEIVVVFQENNGRDNFNMAKTLYEKHLNTFYQEFLTLLKNKTETTSIRRPSLTSRKLEKEKDYLNVETAGQAFNLEHMQNTSNINLFIQSAVEKALNESAVNLNTKRGKVRKVVEKYLKDNDLEDLLTIIKDDKEQKVSIFVGSQILNAIEAGEEGKIRRDLQNRIEAAVEKLGGIKNLKGSDSFETIGRKKAIKVLKTEFSKIKSKNVTMSFEDSKIKQSSKTPITFTPKRKIKELSTKPSSFKAKSKARKATRAQPSNYSMAYLIGAFNQQLPEVVAENMESPRLNYRTGRFASSVRVTDIIKTPKGFPSIGYTYMKYPYQTFEPGYRQGSVERDPRKLIDTSIREIAVQLALGRLYTRRV